MIEVGKQVAWVSQALGCEKEKVGTVLAIVKQNQSAKSILPDTTKKSHIKFDTDIGTDKERVLVAVPAGKGGQITHYYCPNIQMLIAQGN